MAMRRGFSKIPASDRWSIEVEAHPTEQQRWCLVIRLNGDWVISVGCFRSVKAAEAHAMGSLKVRQAIHYGQPDLQAKE
jgi:hypothetical protein